MDQEQETIEVEVVAIDGIAPVPVSAHPEQDIHSSAHGRRNWGEWRNWQGRVRTLDMRWWPLWVFIGIILLFLILTLGVFLGVLYVIYRIIRGVLSAITGVFR